MSGILKRKFEEVDGSSPCSSLRESDGDASGSDSGDSSDSTNPSASSHLTPASILKREKRMRTRSVHFEKVTVYYFSRRQGFTSVPSQGGSTLGMSGRHCRIRHYSLGEFALEQERAHRDLLRDHLKEEKLNSIKLKLTKNGTVESDEATILTVDDISDDDIDLDNTEVDEYFFLQPLTTKKRRALLRASGVKKIDVEEKHELRAIRVSREDCGCDCRVFCDPETCACNLAGIKCQVDRMSFPCGCTKEGCSNTAGRIEFNPIRVRTHFLHTIMKLELEKNREQQQQVSASNGFHTEASAHPGALVASQHSLEYALADGVPQAAMMHLQTPDEMDDALEDEEEDEDEEEEDDENEEDEDEEEDDGSSFCSGLTDSSTQSLAPSDTEEDDEDDAKSDDFEEDLAPQSVPHTETTTLSSVMCYQDRVALQDSHSNGTAYFSSPPPEYYPMENATASTLNPMAMPSEPYSENSPFQDAVANNNPPAVSEQYPDYPRQPEDALSFSQHYTLNNTSSSVIVCSTPDQENNVQPGGHAHMDCQNYLNNNTQEPYGGNRNCFISENLKDVSRGLSEVPSLPDNRKNPPPLEAFSQVTPV